MRAYGTSLSVASKSRQVSACIMYLRPLERLSRKQYCTCSGPHVFPLPCSSTFLCYCWPADFPQPLFISLTLSVTGLLCLEFLSLCLPSFDSFLPIVMFGVFFGKPNSPLSALPISMSTPKLLPKQILRFLISTLTIKCCGNVVCIILTCICVLMPCLTVWCLCMSWLNFPLWSFLHCNIHCSCTP